VKLLSANVGRPRPNPWKGLSATGIDKRPVDGPVAVIAPGTKGTGAVGLVGDRVYDVKHHCGSDQAARPRQPTTSSTSGEGAGPGCSLPRYVEDWLF
jgi:MOSC domain-containing protein YiiM